MAGVDAAGAYTDLFFLDEAVALAAGDRPCGECRRADFNAFRAALGWPENITGLDEILHRGWAVPRVFRQKRVARTDGGSAGWVDNFGCRWAG